MKKQFVYFDDRYVRKSERVLFVDGICPGVVTNVDLELSHWVPNNTPIQYKSDTSTEICQKFIDSEQSEIFGQVSSNHFDTDGLLSVFTLLYPELAISHRSLIEKVSHMGDFGAWQEREASIFYETLANLRSHWKQEGLSSSECFQIGLKTVYELLDENQSTQYSSNNKFDQILIQKNRIESGDIFRDEINSRLSIYSWTLSQAESYGLNPFYSSGFDRGLCYEDMLPSQVRNFFDREKLCLVAVKSSEGMYYDLLIPEYLWAETKNLWIPDGIKHADQTNLFDWKRQTSNSQSFNLYKVCQTFNLLDSYLGQWILADNFNAFKTIPGRKFPVILSHIYKGQMAPSSLSIDQVTELLSKISF